MMTSDMVACMRMEFGQRDMERACCMALPLDRHLSAFPDDSLHP